MPRPSLLEDRPDWIFPRQFIQECVQTDRRRLNPDLAGGGAWIRLEDSLGSGAFFRSLPEDLQIEDHLLTLDIRGLLEFLKGLEPVELPAEEATSQIRRQLSGNPQLPIPNS